MIELKPIIVEDEPYLFKGIIYDNDFYTNGNGYTAGKYASRYASTVYFNEFLKHPKHYQFKNKKQIENKNEP